MEWKSRHYELWEKKEQKIKVDKARGKTSYLQLKSWINNRLLTAQNSSINEFFLHSPIPTQSPLSK